jgi:hypothetical protein
VRGDPFEPADGVAHASGSGFTVKQGLGGRLPEFSAQGCGAGRCSDPFGHFGIPSGSFGMPPVWARAPCSPAEFQVDFLKFSFLENALEVRR